MPAGRGLLIAETFGPTFQGEGPSTGRQALFVRLSRCNLHCPKCDTPETWDWARFKPSEVATRHSVEDLAAWVAACTVQRVIVSGGEPLLQQAELLRLLQLLPDRRVEIETNGTIVPLPELVDLVEAFNVSPKLAGFAALGDQPINGAVLRALEASGKARFKFVVSRVAELDEVASVAAEFALTDVWVMPEGTSSGAVIEGMRELADAVLARGWNLSTRLHVLIWENQRGR
ncbi:7-carboxy-7-deazaguanine synthase QueE [Kitasatospora sp. GP30]|uniref:7-carboxy-7-deazaguanine synthase QueE n=1 Tax=Kitasatospora sp. GP30 TaxID=3035084 RepID=UPI000C70C086|nr:7-carboxy-7-deazaguanine synthase QueE [Kitasatospora sp. GP30]